MRRLCLLLCAACLGAAAFADRDWEVYPATAVSLSPSGAAGSRLAALDAWAFSTKTANALLATAKKNGYNPDIPWVDAVAWNEARYARKPSARPHYADDGRLLGAWMAYVAARPAKGETAKALLEHVVKALVKEREKPEAAFLFLPERWFWPPPEQNGKKKAKGGAVQVASTGHLHPMGFTGLAMYASLLRGLGEALPLVIDVSATQQKINEVEGDATGRKRKAAKKPTFPMAALKMVQELAGSFIWRMSENPNAEHMKTYALENDGEGTFETYHRLARLYGEDGYFYDGNRCFYDWDVLEQMKAKSLDWAKYPAERTMAEAAMMAQLDLERGDFGAFVASLYWFDRTVDVEKEGGPVRQLPSGRGLSSRAMAAFARLAGMRFRLDCNVRYHDALEDALVNGLVPCVATGRALAYAPAVPHDAPGSLAPTADPRVQMAVMRAMADLPTWLFSRNTDKLWIWVNQFVPATLTDEKNGVRLTVAGDGVSAATVRIDLADGAEEKEFVLRLRHPTWCGTNATITVNAASEKPETFAFVRDWTGYHHLPRKWKSGDTLTLSLDPTRRTAANADGTVSFYHGPCLLAATCGNKPPRVAAGAEPTAAASGGFEVRGPNGNAIHLKPLSAVAAKDRIVTAFR